MTEDLESCTDYEYSNEYGSMEEEVDKLNDLTFGDEKSWICENYNIENDDSNFERFSFDDFESDEKDSKKLPHSNNDKDSDNLLGLKGSFFDFGIFKSTQGNNINSTLNENHDDDFECAMGKLHLLEANNNEKVHKNEIFIDSPLVELTKYSETLFRQFQEHQHTSNNSQFLNSIVAKHLNLLSKKLSELSLPMDVLAQLRYFRLLTTFVTIDNRLIEIHARCGSDQTLYNAEMASLASQFSQLSTEQQADLATVHPFFGSLAPATAPVVPPVRNQRVLGEGDWMTPQERQWMAKVQTRNLVSDNPYLHDYYFTVWKYQQMEAARRSGRTDIPDPLSLIPSPISAEQLGAGIDYMKDGLPAPYRPPQFEHSLGVLTACSVNRPRQTIDVAPVRLRLPRPDPEDVYSAVRARRELLGVIEKLHCTVLRVDEVDKALAKMLVDRHQHRPVLQQHRAYLLKVLMDCLAGNERLLLLFSEPKGARILAPVLALVSGPQFLQLLRTLFFNCLSVWESACFGSCEGDLRAVVVGRVRQLGREELSLLITTFFSGAGAGRAPQGPLVGFCRSQFGLCVVFTVLDAFCLVSAADRASIAQLVAITLRAAAGPPAALHSLLEDFQALRASLPVPGRS